MNFMSLLRRKKNIKGEFGSLKLDMHKAYGRLEWGFLKVVLSTIGFGDKWIQWLLQCVTTVSYRVLINGGPSQTIIPHRGISPNHYTS